MANSNTPIIHHCFRNYAYSEDRKIAFLYSPCDTPPHQHTDFYEFTLVTYGSFINEYEGQKLNLPKNTLILFRKGEQHSIWQEQPGSIHFSFIVEQDYFESMFSRYFPGKDISSLGKYQMRTLSESEGGFLTDLSTRLLDNTSQENRDSLSHLFLFDALTFCLMPEQVNTELKGSHIYVEKLLNRLNNYFYLHYSVSEIYKDYPIAQSSLISLFKKRTGYTIVQYHTRKKMEYAAQLLNHSGSSITEVGTMLNFSSLSHFSKLFRAQYGVSPKEYQQLHSRYWLPDENDEPF